MRSKTAKKTAAFVGITALVAIGFALAYWRDFVGLYHLRRLRSDPEYLRQIVNVPEDSVQRSATRKFLETDTGRQRLFDLYLETHEQLIGRVGRSKRAFVAAYGDWLVIVPDARRFGGNPSTIRYTKIPGVFQAARQPMETLLPHLEGHLFLSERHLDRVFSFQSLERAVTDFGLSTRSSAAKLRDVPDDTVGVIVRWITSDDEE